MPYQIISYHDPSYYLTSHHVITSQNTKLRITPLICSPFRSTAQRWRWWWRKRRKRLHRKRWRCKVRQSVCMYMQMTELKRVTHPIRVLLILTTPHHYLKCMLTLLWISPHLTEPHYTFILTLPHLTSFHRDFQARQARQGGVGGNEMKITVRNLRIREDTPKYLRNLALDRYDNHYVTLEFHFIFLLITDWTV